MGAACLGLLLSVPVHALSLGGIQVKSALDEPLRAEITLDSADAQTLESLSVTLGTREDFERAAVPRSELLDQLEFSVDTGGGEPVVVVTTEQPVKEPFLHFLISAEWSGGKLVREYTGLLDPPLYAAEEPASVETPATGEAVAAEEPAGSVAEPSDAGTGSMAGTTGTTAGVSGRSAEYGPTQEGDTLWTIASRLDTGSLQVSVFQVMIALLRENPDAFIDNNINLLKTGQILSLDSMADIAAVPGQEASEIYTAQLEEWQSYKTRVADAGGEVSVSGDTASTADATPGAGDQADVARADTAGQDSDPEVAQGAGDDEVLRIVQATVDESQQSEAAGAGGDRSGEVAELRGQIATLEESLESSNLENQELQERVRLLESQLENAQRLIEIESQELAAAQQQAAEQQAAEQQAAEQQAAEQQAAEQQAAEQQAAEQQAAEQQAAEQQSDPEMAESGADANMVSVENAEETAGENPESAQPEGQQTVAAAGGDAAQSGQQKVRKVATRPPETSWWATLPDMLFSSWMWMVGAGVGVLVLLLGLLMFLRRRQSIAEFEESILSGSALDSYSETTDTAGSSASDTSFLSDFGTAGMGTMQADEVDPLAEAEVYLAYGRDEQAEEVLKEAARRDPDRSEIKLKLLEIYKQRNDLKSFETIAEELYPASEQEDPAIWRQVSAMGRELNPDNPLFQASEETPATETDTGPGTPSAAATAATAATSVAATGTASRAPAPASEADKVDTLDFDLDDLGGEESPGPAGAETVAQTAHQNVEDLELDMDMDTSPSGDEPIFGDETERGGDYDDTLNLGDDFLQRSSRTVDPSEQPFPKPDEQTDLDRELERLAGERESASAPTQVRPAETGGGEQEAPSRDVSWETTASNAPTLDFPASDTSEIDFDLNLDETSVPSQSGKEDAGGDEPELQHGVGDEPGRLDTGEGVLEFESENIPPEETWAGPSSDASPGAAEPDDDSLSYSPDDDVQSAGAPQYNEAETKLDLARAYLDMGDKVGARSIIDEVMREGDPAQRDRAAELASQL